MYFGVEGIERRMDRKINQDLPQQRYTFRSRLTLGGAHEYLLHPLGCGKERFKIVRSREPFAHAVSWERMQVSIPPVYRDLREPFAEMEGRVWGWRRVSEVTDAWAPRLAFSSRGDMLEGVTAPWLQDTSNTMRCIAVCTKLYAEGLEC